MVNILDVCQLGLGLPISLLSPYQLEGDIYHVLAAHRRAPFWSGHRVIIKTDSQVDATILNKDSTCCPVIMHWIRSLFWLIKEVLQLQFARQAYPRSNQHPTWIKCMTSNLTCPPCLLLSLDPRD